MSTIAAGTTGTTALQSTGDTTGNLVFQTNGTTTALTLTSAQAANFTGVVSDAAGKLRAIPQSGSAKTCLLYTSPSPRDRQKSRMPSSA